MSTELYAIVCVGYGGAVCGGLLLWWVVYGLECWLNGAKPTRWMQFRCLYEDLRFNLPGGRRYRLEYARGDTALANSLPGWAHILTMHIALPLAPVLLLHLLVVLCFRG